MNKTKPNFDKVMDPGTFVNWGDGNFTMSAELIADSDMHIDELTGPGMCYDAFDPEYAAENQRIVREHATGERQFVGVIVSARIDNIELGRADLWGIEIRLGHPDDGEYLNAVAVTLAAQAKAEAKEQIARFVRAAA